MPVDRDRVAGTSISEAHNEDFLDLIDQIESDAAAGGGSHAANHVDGGSDELDGDTLDIDFTPSNYTPDATPAEANDVDDLAAHLQGIDTALGLAGGGDHASTHENGGGDEISVTGLSGLLADAQTPLSHASSHVDGGSDELDGDTLDIDFTPSNYTPDATPAEANDVDDLAAHLQGIDTALGSVTPGNHASTHENGGGDEINVAGLSGLLADAQTPLSHASSHVDGGGDELDGDTLDIDFTPSNYTPDATPAEANDVDDLSAHLQGIDTALGNTASSTHASTHENGGGDEINVTGLSGLLADAQTPLSHASSHVDGGADELDGDTLDIDFTPSNYTPDATPAEANDVDDLAAHLKGIDDALAGAGGGGWVDDGSVVRLATASDSVAIGVAALLGSEKVRWVGDVVAEESDLTRYGTSGESTAKDVDVQLTASTTDATQTELTRGGGAGDRITLSDNQSFAFSIIIAAYRTDVAGEAAGYRFDGILRRDSGVGTTTLVNSSKTVLGEDTAAWDADIQADATNGALNVLVTGEGSKTIRWVAVVKGTMAS